jgi:SP family sugar:H+ symporter-like MFS transporter
MEEAKAALAHARQVRADDIHTSKLLEREIEGIRESAEHERKVRAGWLACFNPRRKTLYRTLLGMSLQSLQQLTGANYFFYYGATIFQSVGIDDSFVTQIILGSVNFGCTFGGLYVMERFGRRRPLIIGGLWQSAWLFVFAAAGTAGDPETESIGKLMIIAACLFILGFATTWAPGIWILIGETFPTRTRAKQGALATASNWLWNFLLAFFTPFIVSAIHFSYGFIFAGCNLLGAVVVYFFLYESSGLSLEAVDMMYQDPACKPWNSSGWAPEGYSNREEFETKTKEERASDRLSAATGQAEKGASDEEHSRPSEHRDERAGV